jgi:hypothetical protein
MRRERNGFRANATRPLSKLFLPEFSPRRFVSPDACKRFLNVVPLLMRLSSWTSGSGSRVVASIQFKHLAASLRAVAMCWLKLMLFSKVT